MAGKADRAGAQPRVPHDRRQQGRLADPVAPEQRQGAARRQVERDPLQNDGLAIAGRHAVEHQAAPAVHRARPLAEIDLPHPRIGGDLGGRPFDQNPPLHQDGDPPRQAKHQIHVVLDDQQRDVGGEPFDRLDDATAFARRDAGRRLVEQQHLGREAERHRDLGQALPAIGEGRDRPQRLLGEPDRSSNA